MNRRSFLVSSTAAGIAVSLSGCGSLLGGGRPDDLDDVEPDRQLPVPTLGDGDVTVDVYEDLGCPACQQFRTDVFPILESELIEPGEIAYRHYDFVVQAVDESTAMANAARAVQDETRTDDDPNGAFFTYKTEVMFADDWSDEALAALADEVDVDRDIVMDALEDGTYYPTLSADWERGADAGVEATPTVLVDGDEVEDPFDVDEIRGAVEDAA